MDDFKETSWNNLIETRKAINNSKCLSGIAVPIEELDSSFNGLNFTTNKGQIFNLPEEVVKIILSLCSVEDILSINSVRIQVLSIYNLYDVSLTCQHLRNFSRFRSVVSGRQLRPVFRSGNKYSKIRVWIHQKSQTRLCQKIMHG